MKTLTIKLDEDVLAETEKLTSELNINRDRYISEALRKFNAYNRKQALREEMQRASKATTAESMRVLAEFEALEDDYEDYAN